MALSPDDWLLVKKIAEASQQNFVITQAKDWPMFQWMMVGVAGAWLSTLSLAVYIWKDLKSRISTQRQEDAGRCRDCNKSIWDYIKGPMLNAIMECCYIGDAEKIKLMTDIRSQTDAVDENA